MVHLKAIPSFTSKSSQKTQNSKKGSKRSKVRLELKMNKKMAMRKRKFLKLLKKDELHTSYEIQLIRKEEQDVHKRI